MSSLNITVSLPPLPEGWSGTPDEFMQMIASTIIFNATGDSLTGQVGGAEPTTDVGLWIDGQQLNVWDSTLAIYVPITTVPVGAVLPFFGSVAPANYVFCDNAQYDKAGDYAALYAIIGSLHNRSGDDAAKFRVPDLRGRGLIGAGAGQYGILGDGVLPGSITERSLGDYVGAEWGTLRQTTQPGAPTPRQVYQTRPEGGLSNNTTYYTGMTTPAAVCNYVIRYR